MKNIIFLFCAIAMLQISSCAKKNPFNEPPDVPVIDSLSPAAGFVGTQVRLSGSGFSTYTSQNIVTINDIKVRVDSPSTSTALLVTILENTGTGKVDLTVNGKSAVGPIFTFLDPGSTTDGLVIQSGGIGWYDGKGYSLNMKTLPPTNDGISVLIAGIDIPIAEITRPGTPNYDPNIPNRILMNNDELIMANAAANFAKFQVIHKGVPSNLFPLQIPPLVRNMFSATGIYKFSAADTLTVQGNFFGDGTSLPSSFYMLRNSRELAQPNFISWTNTEIKAIMPAYPELLPDGNVEIDVKVGSLMSYGQVAKYLEKTQASGTVTFIAGNFNVGFADGYGTLAQFSSPAGIAVNANNELFIADQQNRRIRKITNISDAGGMVTTFAGNGTAGFRDGGAADAMFDRPQGVALDENGDVYVADYFNNRIRVISGGIVSTFAGDGNVTSLNGPGDLAMNNHNLMYVTDMLNNRVVEIINQNLFGIAGNIRGYQDGKGANASFDIPFGITVAPDETVYVADAQNNAIRKIGPQGVVTTLAGGTKGAADGLGTAAQFNYPIGITMDRQGNLYVAEVYNTHIRKISPSGQVTTLYPKGKDGTLFNFINPTGLDVNAQGVLFVVDGGANNIYQMTQ